MQTNAIKHSVGRGGVNLRTDIAVVQELLGLRRRIFADPIPILAIDGRCGVKTIDAIVQTQRDVIGLPAPDGRIDPRGRSLHTLLHGFGQREIEDLRLKHSSGFVGPNPLTASPRSKPARTNYAILYRPTARRELSRFTEDVIRVAMLFAGVSRVELSSTRRTASDQARVMYDNCQRYPAVKTVDDLVNQRGWGYGGPGREVETIYYNELGNSQTDVLDAMEHKILDLAQHGQSVSGHCTDPASYGACNVVDIPFSSVPKTQQAELQEQLVDLSVQVKNARPSRNRQGLIDLLVIEDRAWHLELKQHPRALPRVFHP